MITGPFPSELEQLVSAEMQTGAYPSAGEVLLAGVQLLREKRLAYEQLKSDVQRAVAQADQGDYIELDQAGLRQFFNDLKATAIRVGHA